MSSGTSAASRSSTCRTTSGPGLATPAISAASSAISSLTRSRSAWARARIASASAAALRVSDSLRANRSGPILGSAKPSGPASCADSQARCSVSASRAAGRTWASWAAHCGAASSAASISLLTSAIVPSNCPIAVSRWTRGMRPSCRRASASTAGIAASLAATEASRSGSGAKSLASSW